MQQSAACQRLSPSVGHVLTCSNVLFMVRPSLFSDKELQDAKDRNFARAFDLPPCVCTLNQIDPLRVHVVRALEHIACVDRGKNR